MKDKGGAAASGGAAAGTTTTKRSKKSKGRLYTLTVAPLPLPKFNAIVAAIHARKQAEAGALREQIVTNAKRAQEEAWRAAPTVLETGLDALADFDTWGLPLPSTAGAAASAEEAAAATMAGAGAGAESAAVSLAGGGGDGKGQEERKDGNGEGEGAERARKRQQTMADVVQLHRKLSGLQKARTELRWLLEQVERLEYEAL